MKEARRRETDYIIFVILKNSISGGRALGPPLRSGGPKPSSDPKLVFLARKMMVLKVKGFLVERVCLLKSCIIANSLLYIVYCLLSTVYCLLSMVCCLLYIANCLLYIVYCLWYIANSLLYIMSIVYYSKELSYLRTIIKYFNTL